MGRILLHFIKPLHSIAKSLDAIAELYKLDCASRGIYIYDPKLKDDIEITYDVKEPIIDEDIWL